MPLDVLQSSQAFVRALKSTSDPPYENGPSKIYIARQGWDSKTLYVPGKAKLILEWILTRFHKEKIKKSHENPLIDSAHWSLLADILAATDGSHIVPLITRTSIPAILSSFLVLYHRIPYSRYESLFPPVLRSLNVLWPLAVKRASIDTLSECLWTSLSIFDQIFHHLDWNRLVEPLGLVFNAFLSAFSNANAAGKKKAYLALVQNQLFPWLRAMGSLPSVHILNTQLYSVGAEILFNPDSLRASLESNPNANTSSDIFSTLFGPSTISDQGSNITLTFIALLPRLAQSYLTALRKRRSTIFMSAQGGQQAVRERLQHAATRFGNACFTFLKDSESSPRGTESIWNARVGVLAVLEADSLFAYTEKDDISYKMREIGSDAVDVLKYAWDISHSNVVVHSLDALSCLHRIEPALLDSFIPQILNRMAICSASVGRSSVAFLSQLVSYHSKTRTLHTLMSLLLTSVTSTFSFLPPSDARAIYEGAIASPILSLPFADELANALRTFMTPGQADAIVTSVHTVLESFLPGLISFEEPVQKRRKISVDEAIGIHGNNTDESNRYDVVRFALVARLGATMLTAVLQSSLRADATKRRKVCLDHIDSMISGVLEPSFEAGRGETAKVSKKGKGKRSMHEDDVDVPWRRECLLTALLRLWYDLYARNGSPGAEMEEENTWSSPVVLDNLHSELMRRMRDVGAWPELQLEIGRVLYARGTSTLKEGNDNDADGWPALDVVLNYIESSLTSSSNSDSPRRHTTIFTRWETALALWGLTLERYISVVDEHAPPAQLDRLTGLIIRMRSGSNGRGDKQEASGSSALTRALTSASFWELDNIRTSMLTMLDKQTAEFTSIDAHKLLSALVQEDSKAIKALLKASTKTLDAIDSKINVYRLLHYFPPEYLSRSSKLELARRALIADVLVRALSNKSEPTMVILEWRTILRSFVAIVAKQSQTRILDEIASYPDWMPYLTLSKNVPTSHNETFISSTSSLLSMVYIFVIRASSSPERKENNLLNIIAYFIQCIPIFGSSMRGEIFAQQSLLRFLSILVREFKVSSFTSNVLGLFRRLCSDFEDALKPVANYVAGAISAAEFLESGHIIDAWQGLLSFKQWLSIPSEKDAFGESMLKKTVRIMNSTNALETPKEFRAKVLSLLIQEGQLHPKEECRHIGNIAAAYILFAKSAPETTSLCDELVAQASKTLSVVQYEAFLEIIAEAIQRHSSTQSEYELGSLVHLSMILLREAPDRTAKLCHEHVARCLREFVNRPVFTEGPTMLIVQMLDFIHSQCIERPASLNLADIACLWPILSRLLIGSIDHDSCTSNSVFQTIASIVNSLIRLRRDLIVPHLPQLSMTLRQLTMVIRGVRPSLGHVQYHLVSDTLPKWIDPREPLGEEETRSLARLLVAISTKSFVRNHSNGIQKAESLARPFARHAPYVLLAYIQLMNDPLNMISMAIRRELEPGLFALCGMMGEHGRDTLMVQSLDVGGKALLKSLWKEYEKQKYVGRG